MKRSAIIAAGLALAGGAAWWWLQRMINVRAFLALIRSVESRDDYSVIAGGDHFDDFSEHPFVLDPNRSRPLGTTASGAYQQVRKTWALARDALGLPDFSPASQDAAAKFILTYKVPGADRINPQGTGVYDLVAGGKFDDAIVALRLEWESFDKMLAGSYHVTLAQAREFIEAQGGAYAAA